MMRIYQDEDDDDDDDRADDIGEDDNDLDECPACGRRIFDDSVRCPRCGHYLTREQLPRTTSQPLWVRFVALLLVAMIFYGVMHQLMAILD